jgi:hypothetical protein
VHIARAGENGAADVEQARCKSATEANEYDTDAIIVGVWIGAAKGERRERSIGGNLERWSPQTIVHAAKVTHLNEIARG